MNTNDAVCNNLVAVDTETGGVGELECRTHALLSVGISAVLKTGMAHRRVMYMWPGEGLVVDPRAAEVNGYSELEWRARGAVSEAVGVLRVFHELMNIRMMLGVERLQLVAHNVGHDRGFLGAAFARYGLTEALEGKDGVANRRWECSCAGLALVRRAGILPPGGCSLNDLTAARLGRPVEEVVKMRGALHEAGADATWALDGYLWLAGLVSGMKGLVMEALTADCQYCGGSGVIGQTGRNCYCPVGRRLLEQKGIDDEPEVKVAAAPSSAGSKGLSEAQKLVGLYMEA